MGHVRRIAALPLLWAVLVACVAILPWWRNHDYLRDFFDYGLVMAGNGRIAAGERPYVDFTTPIQCGIFWLNLAAERCGDGGYLAMTRGAALLIVLSATGFTLMLARRWPVWLAALAALAVTLGNASQHTIVWHNTLGVICLALVAWSAALAPVWRRSTWLWHAATMIGLIVGGVNKLNFHLVALAVACGWAFRAWCMREQSFWRACATVGVWVVAGTVVPWSIELAWTGAAWPVWFYNVVELASGSRAGELARIVTLDFYLQPTHDYYGALSLPQVGAVGLLACVLTGGAAWSVASAASRPSRCRTFAVLGAALAFAMGAALVATNFEIACVGLSAWVVLAIALWLGFDLPTRGLWVKGLAIVLGLLAVFGGESAWRGQRSQFGHVADSRGSYVDAGTAGPAFRYLSGLRVPASWIDSFRAISAHMPAPKGNGLRPVFYGPGIEWMERAFPAEKFRGLPLWAHWRTSYSDREFAQLDRLIGQTMAFDLILVPVAWDYWDESIRPTVELGCSRQLSGPLVAAYRPPRLRTLFEDAFRLVSEWGGNTALPAWDSGEITVNHSGAGREIAFGRAEGETALTLREPVNHVTGEAVVRRLRPGGGKATVEFTVIVPGEGADRWWADVTLEPGENEKRIAYDLQVDGHPLAFKVRVPPEYAGAVFGGYFGPRVQHAGGEVAGLDSALRPTRFPVQEVPPGAMDGILPHARAKVERAFVRGARWREDVLELLPAGELWLKFDRPLAALVGRVVRARSGDGAPDAVLRAAWTRGARLEVMMQEAFRPDEREMRFRMWSPEEGGWFVFTLDPSANPTPVTIRIDEIAAAP